MVFMDDPGLEPPDLPDDLLRESLICVGCNKTPSDDTMYRMQAEHEGITPEEYVIREEGTLNPKNGHYLCDMCYIKAGQPSSPRGWKAP